MKGRRILLKEEMVKAIQAGIKTQMRWVMKPQLVYGTVEGLFNSWYLPRSEGGGTLYPNGEEKILGICPFGLPGDKLWVEAEFADWWKPSANVNRSANRSMPEIIGVRVEITGVRVERLQDISDLDALSEGATSIRSQAWDREHFPVWRYEYEEARNAGLRPPRGPTTRSGV